MWVSAPSLAAKTKAKRRRPTVEWEVPSGSSRGGRRGGHDPPRPMDLAPRAKVQEERSETQGPAASSAVAGRSLTSAVKKCFFFEVVFWFLVKF